MRAHKKFAPASRMPMPMPYHAYQHHVLYLHTLLGANLKNVRKVCLAIFKVGCRESKKELFQPSLPPEARSFKEYKKSDKV